MKGMLTSWRVSACIGATFAVVVVVSAACSTTNGVSAVAAADAGARPRQCCTTDTFQCGPRSADGGCNVCCVGDVCGLPPDPDGTCRGLMPGSCGTPPTKADLDQSGGWKPPPAMQKACSASDLAAFEASLKSRTGSASYSDLIKGLPAACGSCILGKEANATWTFVVTDDKGELGFINDGACYARAGGGSDACGKAVQYEKFCIKAACSDCASASESSKCETDTATLTACSNNFEADIAAACGDQAKRKTLDDACSKPALAVGVLCGGGAGVSDAGDGG
jgi:hypothetical protein